MKNKSKTISFSYALVITAIVVVLSFICTCFAVSSASNSSQADLNAALSYADDKVKDFNSQESKIKFDFTDKIYSKANTVALLYSKDTTDEDLQKITRDLYIDSVVIVDSNNNCVASYPEDYKGKNIKKTDDYASFSKIVKGMAVKLMSEPVLAEGSSYEYSLLAGVPQSDGTGAVIIGITTDDYANVNGANLAEDCGRNVIIAKDGEIISSTFGSEKKDKLEDLGINDSDLSKDSFNLKYDGNSYLCKTSVQGDYTIICASQQSSSAAVWVILIIEIVLLLCAAVMFALSPKFSEFFSNFFDIKFWKFILVGIINTLVGNGLQFVFYACFGWDKFQWGVWLASALGYLIGSIVSYFLNKYFTFKNKEKGWKPIARFALNIAICYAIAYGIAIPVTKWICVANSFTMFGLRPEVFADYASMLIGACLFVATNYIGQRFFAFREKKTDNNETK